MNDSSELPATRISWAKKAVFSLFPVVLLLGLAEIAVRFTGAAEHCPNHFSDSNLWACDPVMEFKLNPTFEPRGEPLNAEGFRTHEFTPKRPGTLRIVSIGDSCTIGALHTGMLTFVEEPYPSRLERMISESGGTRTVEVFNAGIPGYNSWHGLMLLRTRLRNLEPDLITVRFGWNDHFLTLPVQGGGRVAFREPESWLGRTAERLLLRTALYPFARRLALELTALRLSGEGAVEKALEQSAAGKLTYRPTISLEAYARNLRRIVEIGRAQGARVWLLTAPQNPFPNEEALATMTLSSGTGSVEELVAMHTEYVDVTRRVGEELGVPVVDMDALYRAEYAKGESALFLPTDVPHPAQAGHDFEARMLYERLEEAGLLR